MDGNLVIVLFLVQIDCCRCWTVGDHAVVRSICICLDCRLIWRWMDGWMDVREVRGWLGS